MSNHNCACRIVCANYCPGGGGGGGGGGDHLAPLVHYAWHKLNGGDARPFCESKGLKLQTSRGGRDQY